MINYTTPILHLIIEDRNLTVGQDVRVTLQQGQVKITKKGADLTLTVDGDDTDIKLTFTQEESAMFKPNKGVEVEVNWINASGVREATDIQEIEVSKNLLNEVISYGD